jgi:putative ABC transport system ATP-binding protein
MTDQTPAVELRAVTKRYRRGARDVVAVERLTLTVARGEFLSIMGPSGSGKSTLLNLISGLDVPTEGEVIVEGLPVAAMNDDQVTDMRRTRVGLIFQFFNLLPKVSALANVALPLRAAGVGRRPMMQRAQAALDLVGLGDRADHRPGELSGGEMQRVAVARALVIDPAIILADEPTGNLDSSTGEDVLRLIRQCNRDRGVSVVLVTHSPTAAAYADRVITLQDGAIVGDVINRPARSVR